MAFTVNDLEDLLKLLREHPEWRTAVRQEVLGEELLALPDLVRQNSEAIDRLTSRMDELASRMDELASRMDELAIRMGELRSDVDRLTVAVTALTGHVGRMEVDLGGVKGDTLEMWYRAQPQVLAQRRGLRRISVPVVTNLELVDAALESGALTAEQVDSLYNLDLIISGREGSGTEARDALIAVEVSNTIDRHDISRAIERAELLRSIGYTVYPMVAGREINPRARQHAEQLGVDVHLRPVHARSA